MIALSRGSIVALLALGALILLGVFVGFRYGSLSPCEMLRQDLIRAAEYRGESRTATELRFREVRPNLSVPTCIAAYLSLAPSTYIRQF